MEFFIYSILGICIFAFIFLIYGIIKQNKLKKLPEVIENLKSIDDFNKSIDLLKKGYITCTQKKKIKNQYKCIYNFFLKEPFSKIKDNRIKDFSEVYVNIDKYIKNYNSTYVDNEIKNNEKLFNNIDGKSLDSQQRKAVVVDEENNLILAGAGSGKTLTISAKVKYLVDKKHILPEEILLITFTKKAAEEMSDRIYQKLNIKADVKTFHKLGLDIITNHRNERPDITDDLNKIINQYFNKQINNDQNEIESLITFFAYYLNIPKDMNEFSNLGERCDHYKSIDFETLKSKYDFNLNKELNKKIKDLKDNKETLQGETVKSLEEVLIANFLFLNGINYVYEYKYPFETQDKYRKNYRPDFYLSDYDIYIEHFGITKDYKAPWLSKIEEKKYIDGIKWKRELHKKNKTTLIETYSFYNKEGTLLTKLKEKLEAHNVKFIERDYKNLYNIIFKNNEDKYFSEFKKLISTFLNLYKSNGYEIKKFDEMKNSLSDEKNEFMKNRAYTFIDLVKPIYEIYQDYLNKNKSIDFNDIINEASQIVNDGESKFRYKYIIIDEYQDISMSRYKLIKEIKMKTNAKVIAVGDDWQSIYRFTGSDVDLFTNFGKYFGDYELLKIENTYRNSQELINIAGKFVMKNPKQFKKELKSSLHNSNPLRIIEYNQKGNSNVNFKYKTEDDFASTDEDGLYKEYDDNEYRSNSLFDSIMKCIDEIVNYFGEKANILILGRNNYDVNLVHSINIFNENKEDISNDELNERDPQVKVNKINNQETIRFSKYPNLKVQFLTVHRSKGLEADNVIIVNLRNREHGFPNQKADDPILSLVQVNPDSFAYAEERRLFYVALTRTKNVCYLITPKEERSVFCEELNKDFKINFEGNNKNIKLKEALCPKCQKGVLVIRESKDNKSQFLGCSNYPHCDYTSKHIEIINNQIKCSSCGGYMVKRVGNYGYFYGCTNYPYCTNTLKIQS